MTVYHIQIHSNNTAIEQLSRSSDHLLQSFNHIYVRFDWGFQWRSDDLFLILYHLFWYDVYKATSFVPTVFLFLPVCFEILWQKQNYWHSCEWYFPQIYTYVLSGEGHNKGITLNKYSTTKQNTLISRDHYIPKSNNLNIHLVNREKTDKYISKPEYTAIDLYVSVCQRSNIDKMLYCS